MDKLKLHTPDLTASNIERLAELFPGCVTEARDENGGLTRAVDFEQLRQELSDSVIEGPRERYHLDWPGKREATLAANSAVAKTLRPCRDESVNFDVTTNLFIEGDNLDALKLLQETYLGDVKMVYIDPPYNTGKEFIYTDDFAETAEEYLTRTYQRDQAGNRMELNTVSNGRFHSDWLTMMYSRLKLARNLLTDDGVLFISIDENEVANLRKLCDEVFGPGQFVAQIVVQSNKRGQTYKEIAKTHEYILVYSREEDVELNEIEKSGESLPHADSKGPFDLWELRNRNPKFGRHNRPNLFFPLFVAPGCAEENNYARISLKQSAEYYIEVLPLNSQAVEGCWRWGRDKVSRTDLSSSSPVLVARQRRDGNWNIYEKSRKATTKVKSIWSDTGVISEQGTLELGTLGMADVFDHPKPLELVKRCIHLATSENDTILDFFAGSGTTAHATMQLNAEDGVSRRFILVQVPETCGPETSAFSKGYRSIADITKERLRRAGKVVAAENSITNPSIDVGFRVVKIGTSCMKDVYYAPDEVRQKDLLAHLDNIREDRTPEDLLFQVLVDWGVDLSLPIATEQIEGKSVFFVDQTALSACFDSAISEELVKTVARRKPLRAVFRDLSYGSDSVKINVEQIFKLLSPSTEVRSL